MTNNGESTPHQTSAEVQQVLLGELPDACQSCDYAGERLARQVEGVRDGVPIDLAMLRLQQLGRECINGKKEAFSPVLGEVACGLATVFDNNHPL